MKSKPLVLYLCDGKDPRCSGVNGCMKDCFHTSNIEHAKSDPELIKDWHDSRIFRKYVTNDGDVQIWQRRFASCDAATAEPKVVSSQ